MRLIEELKQRLVAEPSLFRAQLLREDIVRIEKLGELARTTPDVEAYRIAGRRLGWTAQDARTSELAGALERLLDAVRDVQATACDDAEARLRDAWVELTRVRLERLVGCLSTPAEKPVD